MIDSKQDEAVKLEAWTKCPRGSCHRHRGCKYTPCLAVPRIDPDKQEALAGEGVDKPTFEQLLTGAKLEVSRGRGDGNCTYILAAQGEAYPRTCRRCGLGPCPFSSLLMEGYQNTRTLSSNEALAGDDRNGVEGFRGKLDALRDCQMAVGEGPFCEDDYVLVRLDRLADVLTGGHDLLAALSRTPSPQADEKALITLVGREVDRRVEFLVAAILPLAETGKATAADVRAIVAAVDNLDSEKVAQSALRAGQC